MSVKKPLVLTQQRRSRAFLAQPGWKEIEGKRIFFRSAWEYLYAVNLSWLKKNKVIAEWEHEPQTFWFEKIKRGVRSYLPDFKVTNPDGSHYWVEVKGYMDARSATKIKRFRKYYPDEKIVVVDKQWFRGRNGKPVTYQVTLPPYEE